MQGCECSKGGWVSPRWDYGIFGQGEWGIWVGTERKVRVGHMEFQKLDQRGKVIIGNRRVIEMKQGSLEMGMGWGEVKVEVLVWGCTECNKHPMKLAQLRKRSSSSAHLEITQNVLHFWLPVWGAWGLSWDTLGSLNTFQRYIGKQVKWKWAVTLTHVEIGLCLHSYSRKRH